MAHSSLQRRSPRARTRLGLTFRKRFSARLRSSRRKPSDFKPRLEALEDRRLMAADLQYGATEDIALGDAISNSDFANASVDSTFTTGRQQHNSVDPEDVNDDGECTPIDALLIINELNAGAVGNSQHFIDVNDDGTCAPVDALLVINRLNNEAVNGASGRAPTTTKPTPSPTPAPTTEVRSIDGTGNNLAHPEWGSTDEQLLRVSPAAYGDGISTAAGVDRPSAREISNALAAHSDEDTPSDRNLTAYIYVWGQFLDHDLDLTGGASPTQSFNITVPSGDPEFDPTGSGTQVIPLSRSVYDTATGTSTTNPRQQINQITAWIDGSMIYGSDTTRAAAVRSLSGGKLLVSSSSEGDLPPANTAGLPMANDAHRVDNTQLFLTGDVRGNENIELTSLHALFIREHNRLADQIAAQNPSLSDEAIYQKARAMVIAEIQSITYNQWLPALLGSGAIKAYQGYNANVNPDIANEFSTAAFRLHTTINDDVEFFDNNGRPITFDYYDEKGIKQTVDGEVALFEAFFNPTMFKQTGVDGILKYAASTHAEEVDNQLVDSLRNFLFGAPGQGGLDLAALNIQRGRDHGLADYNTTRAAYGLPKVTSFAQITSDPQVQATLQDLYKTVDNIDLWVGGLAEDHVRGSSMGPLFQKIIADQFQRLRDGDRLWFERTFTGQQLAQIEHTTLADIIERNTGVEGLQNNVFLFRADAGGRVYEDKNANGHADKNETPLAKVTVELLNDAGDVIATTLTGKDGRYSFNQFPETGDFHVRVVLPTGASATTLNLQKFLISAGDASIRNLNFGIKLAAPTIPAPSDPGPAPGTTTDDIFEDNDTLGAAANLGTVTSTKNVDSLVMADANDWYRFTTTTAGAADSSLSISFLQAQGNLDLRLYNSRGQLLKSSLGVTDGEQVSLNGLAAGTYFIRVSGNSGALNPSYSLTIKPTAPVTQPPTFASGRSSTAAASTDRRLVTNEEETDWSTAVDSVFEEAPSSLHLI